MPSLLCEVRDLIVTVLNLSASVLKVGRNTVKALVSALPHRAWSTTARDPPRP